MLEMYQRNNAVVYLQYNITPGVVIIHGNCFIRHSDDDDRSCIVYEPSRQRITYTRILRRTLVFNSIITIYNSACKRCACFIQYRPAVRCTIRGLTANRRRVKRASPSPANYLFTGICI